MNAAKRLDSAPEAAAENDDQDVQFSKESKSLQVKWDEVRSWAQALANTYQSRPLRIQRGAMHRV